MTDNAVAADPPPAIVPHQAERSPDARSPLTRYLARWANIIGIDWGATLLVGIIAVLAIAGALPKVPW